MRLALVLSSLLLTGCNGVLVTFTTTIKGTTTLQGSPLGGFFSLFPQVNNFNDLNFDDNQDFKNNNAQKAHVKTAKVTSFTLKITDPANQNYDFLDSVKFSVESPSNNTTELAHKDGIASLGLAAPNPTLVLDVPGEDIAAHIRADDVTFSSSGSGRQPNDNVTVEANVTLLIGAGL
jgi:hypothetical protein